MLSDDCDEATEPLDSWDSTGGAVGDDKTSGGGAVGVGSSSGVGEGVRLGGGRRGVELAEALRISDPSQLT